MNDRKQPFTTIMTRALYSLLLLLFLAAPIAQGQQREDREAFLRDMKRQRQEFITNELQLTQQQQQKFFPLYDAMSDEIKALNDNVRQLQRSVEAKGSQATDAERTAVAQALFELKGKESEVEMRYFPKFKQILNSTQLMKLKKAERDFNRQMLRNRRDHRQNNQGCRQAEPTRRTPQRR